jgi:hypothetical protein
MLVELFESRLADVTSTLAATMPELTATGLPFVVK